MEEVILIFTEDKAVKLASLGGVGGGKGRSRSGKDLI